MRTHAIVSTAALGRAGLERLLASFRAAPPAYLQLRDKAIADRELLAFAREIRAALPASSALLVNGRPDVAVAAGAQGVQLPADGLPAGDVRRAFPPPFLVGVSCHALAELRGAADAGADFALLAPVYAPASKPGDTRTPLGPEALDALVAPPPLPIHVLGGITPERLASWPAARLVKVAAAAGVGVFADAKDAGTVVRAFAALDEVSR